MASLSPVMPASCRFGPTMSDSDGDAAPARLQSVAELRVRAAWIGEPQRLDGAIELVPYDADWAAQYQLEADTVTGVLGARVLALEHVGSTSVSGLAAKPIIDMLLVVTDSSEEDAYVPPLQEAGYTLRIRERDWHEHRLLKGPGANI